jgi:predicted GNAT superfamily acetyltransferase
MYDPRGVTLALDAGAWVGMTMTSLHKRQRYAFSEMTGVLRSHRRQGMSLALKVLAIDFARDSGMRWLRTFHHPANDVAILMNRRLGFVDDTDEMAD